MHDAAPGRHQVHGSRLDQLAVAQAVAMHDLAFEQVGDRREADVRMRPHVDAAARRKHGRAHVIEKHERPDHAALGRGQARAGRRTRPGCARAVESSARSASSLAVPDSSLTESPPQPALHSQGIMAYDPDAYFVHLARLAAARRRRQRGPAVSGGARPAAAGAVGRHRAFRSLRYRRRRRSRRPRGPRRSTISAVFRRSSISCITPRPAAPTSRATSPRA